MPPLKTEMKKTNSRPQIVYMGTPDFATAPLRALVNNGNCDIRAVITQPDRQRGRGKKLSPTPVKALALELGLRVESPEDIRGQAFIDMLRSSGDLPLDLIIVCAYGKLLPPDVLDLPRFGCINIHASLLPKFRGAAPIERAIEAGEAQTGVTLMHMDAGLDTGDMLAKAYLELNDMNASETALALSELGSSLLLDKLPDLLNANVIRETQDESQASYAPMLRKEDGHINFGKQSDKVIAQINAMNPRPGSFAILSDEKIKIIRAKISNELEIFGNLSAVKPGQILEVADSGIAVRTMNGAVLITELQLPNKKPMHIKEFLKGNELPLGLFS